ncbi:MAG: cupredoxin domain-containing protein [Candidatus Korobacteraceae bacterium]
MKNKLLILATLTILLAIGSVSGTYAAPADAHSASETAITIDNFSFTPATVTVPVGTTVRWTNRDDIPNTVVSDDKMFRSKALDTDEQFTYTFTKPGAYSYFCSLHPKMTAKVVVQ